ncbi:hypothetical protein CPB83DRAFT_57219 [Crepidotus variabilis]|uniref:Probable quinone oxidoreductase n=1 Tax=Crepidotus variabilis TaxID=179855 RepID=A0A9P6ENL9_9AGAR|nr:hypothetical protein CPB83DRAFT_57219 [Crepidotus variabilis]
MTLPSTVEVITISKPGGVEVIEKTIQPFPLVNASDVVIKYLGVNFIDTYYRQGLYKMPSFPAGIGQEMSGIIIALPTDESILNNETYKRKGLKVGSKVVVDIRGAHATYAAISWALVSPVPESVSTRIAAAGYLQGTTVCAFVEEAYKVKPGDTILVHTIAGGVGLQFAQIGKHIGVTVIGTTSTPEKAKLAKENGAAHVILYNQEDVVKRVLDLTNGEGVDAIFDGVGKDTFLKNFEMIKRKGTIVSYGNASGAVEPFSILKLAEKNVKLLRPKIGNYAHTPEEILHYSQILFDLIEKEILSVRVFKEYPFTGDGVKAAHIDLTGGKTSGKLIIKV